jgi:hypothetical protein
MASISYELHLHGKQGDDFAACLDETQDQVALALRRWAAAFKANHDACLQIASGLDGKQIEAQADVHFISFTPGNDQAIAALEALVKEDLLYREEWDDDESDDDADDE